MIFVQIQLARDKQEGENYCYFNYEFGILKTFRRGRDQTSTIDFPPDITEREDSGTREGLGVENIEFKRIS